MEGGKEMNDILLGVIIGGAIGVIGSGVVAWIQAHYSQKQQSRQIQHEKNSEVLSRRIALRSRYLEPLTSHLCSTYVSATSCAGKLMEFTGPYYTGRKTEEVKVPEVDKEEFMEQMDTIQRMCEEIDALDDKVHEAAGQVGDPILIDRLTSITEEITKFYKAYNEMYSSLHDTAAEQDFVHDFKPIMKSIENVTLCIPSAHDRIESLLSGVDEDDE